MKDLLLSLSAFLLFSPGVLGTKVFRITSADDLIELSKDSRNYSDAIVYLDRDINFAKKTLTSIGTNEYDYFRGSFDGQGHTISNLIMNSSSRFAGFFGFSRGAVFKNVVFDSSCSFTSTYGKGSEWRST